MRVSRPLILAGILGAGGFLGWALHAYSDEAAELLLAASGSADLPVSQPAEAHGGETVVRLVIVTDSSAAPPAAETVREASQALSAEVETVDGSVHTWPVEAQPAPTTPYSNETYVGVQEVSLNAQGDHIVIAHDRSVVLVGDDGRLNANAGDVSSSGALAIDAQQSTLETGDATTPLAQLDAQPSTLETGDATTPPAQLVGPHASLGRGDGRATALSGWEDHSLLVAGSDQVVTYDDSNVFIDRDGKLNMNTGDTDSSGLNVVDATRSIVRTGNHIEDGEEDEQEEDEEDEGSASDGASSPLASPATLSTVTPTSSASVADEGDSSASVADEGDSVATGRDAFVVGADGVDDLAVDAFGQRNVVTYDDSNVAVGGAGDVNAQIGDSDTSGGVVMGVTDSVIASGNST